MNILSKKSKELRLSLFKKFHFLQEGHPGSTFSILDFLITIYYKKFVRIKNKKVIDDVIMSKGHATVAQYSILKDKGIISKKDWDNWGTQKKSCLRMFGNNNIPGIKVATGSLGHGIGLGTGIALAYTKKKQNKRVFVIISEGELYEGSKWESLFLLNHLKLKNLNLIIDVNNNIILGKPKDCLPLGNIKKKIESFGIKTYQCDGHDFKKIENNLNKMKKNNETSALIINTIKGKGFKIMENKPHWHYWNKITQKQFLESIKELKKN